MSRIECPVELGIAGVRGLHAQLLAEMKKSASVELGLGEVRRLDAAGAQLIFAAKAAGVRLVEPSADVRATMAILGLDATLAKEPE